MCQCKDASNTVSAQKNPFCMCSILILAKYFLILYMPVYNRENLSKFSRPKHFCGVLILA